MFPPHQSYFFDHVQKIVQDEFTPNLTEFLKTYSATTGVFHFDGTIEDQLVRITDIGGRSSERRKWRSFLDQKPHLVFYFVALDDYDGNRLDQSLETWGELTAFSQLEGSLFILVLNRKDKFKKKLHEVPLSHYDPELGFFQSQDHKFCISYMIEKFQAWTRGSGFMVPFVTNSIKQKSHHEILASIFKTLGF